MNPNNTETGAFFGFLGLLLQNDPSEQSVGVLKKERLFESLPYAQNNSRVIEGQKLITEWLANDNDAVMNARCDYMRLFSGLNSQGAPAYSSFYLTNERLTFQAKTLDMRDIYRQHGLEVVKKNQEPDDHIGYELEFLAQLCDRGLHTEAKQFANERMMNWVPLWAKDVEKNASTDYYKGLAKIIVGGLEEFVKS